jgi:hypothetical protein
MHLGDFASWAAIIGAGVGATGLLFTASRAVSRRQRELRGQLREVLRVVSEACDDYDYADRRVSASLRLRDAAEKIKVIHDEGILSPSPPQIDHFQKYVEALAGQAQASTHFVQTVGSMVGPEERERLRAGQERNTEMMLRYVARMSDKYRHVTRKMDNGHIETYLHYRLLAPFIVRRANSSPSAPVNKSTQSR